VPDLHELNVRRLSRQIGVTHYLRYWTPPKPLEINLLRMAATYLVAGPGAALVMRSTRRVRGLGTDFHTSRRIHGHGPGPGAPAQLMI
jgi:hypothetical protein